MRFMKKSGAIAAVVALTALAGAASASAAGTGLIVSDTPIPTSCDFTFSHTGSFPGTVTATSVVLNPATCPSGLAISPTVTLAGNAAGVANVTSGSVTSLGCTYQLSGANSGTWNGTAPTQNAQFLNKNLSAGSPPIGCLLLPKIHVVSADFHIS